jgi:periplasmic protein TonB
MQKFCIYLLFTFIHTVCFAQETVLQVDSIKVYTHEELDQNAQFISGEKGLNKFIRKNIAYPKAAEEAREGGLVVVSIIIDQQGQVHKPKIIKSSVASIPVTSRKDLQDEAARVCLLSGGNWIPAKAQDKAVASIYYLPIRFTPPYSKKQKK